MIEEKGRVVALDKTEGSPGTGVWIETIRQTACQSCSARKGCGHSALAKLGQQNTHIFASSRFDHSVGDMVVIGVPEDVVIKGSLIAYLMPLVLMLVGAIIADGMAFGDFATTLISLLGLGVGFGLVRLHFFKSRGDVRYQPVVLRKVLAENHDLDSCSLTSA